MSKVLWKLLICILACQRPQLWISIGMKECSESCPLSRSAFMNSGRVFIRIKCDQMLAWEMYLEMVDSWCLLVDGEVEDAPGCFRCRDISRVKVPLDFIITSNLLQWSLR